MMDWTDRLCLYFLRLFSKEMVLYTEMVVTAALIHGDRARLLAYHPDEKPLVLQLGGSDPQALAQCAVWAEEAGFSGVNLNVGCPSDRVQQAKIGACLMAEPAHVALCVRAMKSVVRIPITVKTRVGIDHHDEYDFLLDFVRQQQEAGVDQIIVHARKAWLYGLNPKQNRTVPILEYEKVYRLKADVPDLSIVINGGIVDVSETKIHLAHGVDGVMIGRAAYHNPCVLGALAREILNEDYPIERFEVIERLVDYAAHELAQGTMFWSMARHWLGLFTGVAGARAWRVFLSDPQVRAVRDMGVFRGLLEEIIARERG
jgi:tRNA-dihydrouridine synthase A